MKLYATKSENHQAFVRSEAGGHEVAIVTMSGYKVGSEPSQFDLAELFAASPVLAERMSKLIGMLNAAKILDASGGYHTAAILEIMEIEKRLGYLGYGRLAKKRGAA
jgi:hypothetical protein